MPTKRTIAILAGSLISLCLLQSCNSLPDSPPPTLIINSGFEPNTQLFVYNSDIYGFKGMDQSRKGNNDWQLASQDPSIGDIYCKMETNATAADRDAAIVADPLDAGNHALCLSLSKATETNPNKGRVQMELGENAGLSDAYFQYRLFLPASFDQLNSYTYAAGATPDWLTLMELWGDPDVPISEPYPFRITLYAIKTSDNLHLEFGVRADKIDRDPAVSDPSNWAMLWQQSGDSFVIPTGEWITLRVWYRQGPAANGRFWLSVQRAGQAEQVLFDILNATNHPANPNPQGLRWFNPAKLYCSKAILDRCTGGGAPLKIYVDDLQIWKNKSPF